MNKIKYIILILTISFVSSCSNDNNEIQEKQYLNFKFDSNTKSSQILELEVEVISYNPIKLKSEFLREVSAINKETGKEMYGYVLINDYTKSNGFNSSTGPADDETGYFFDGECFVFGTMYYGDNGVNLFVECGYNCIGFPDVCPGDNEAFA